MLLSHARATKVRPISVIMLGAKAELGCGDDELSDTNSTMTLPDIGSFLLNIYSDF